MLKQLQRMLNGHPGKFNTATHYVAISSSGARKFYAIQYHAGLKAQKAYEEKIDRVLTMKIIELAQIDCTLPIIFYLKKRRNPTILRRRLRAKSRNHLELVFFTRIG